VFNSTLVILHWAVIRNASDLPVFDVRVSYCVPVDPASGLTWRQGERYVTDPPPVRH
jgi:hypothetical protein